MSEPEPFIWNNILFVNGERYNGRLGVNMVTNPVVPIERMLYGDMEGVEVTTEYVLLPALPEGGEGEPVPVELKSMRSIVQTNGTITAIEV